MQGKNYVVSLDELLQHYFPAPSSRSKKAIPDLFKNVPKFKTERDMYDHFTSVFNQSSIFPGQTFVTTAWKSDPNDTTKQAIDCGMYPTKFAPKPSQTAAGDESRRTDWSRIDLCIECKLHSTNQDPFDEKKPENEPEAQERREVLGQILSYAELVFKHQQRNFHYMLLLFRESARIIFFDHSGIVVTKKVSYATEGAQLTEFLVRYGRLKSAEYKGNDPTAMRIENADPLHILVHEYAKKSVQSSDDHAARLFQASLVESWPLWKLKVYDEETDTDHWFAVGKPHFQAPGVAGRGTRGYVALPLDDDTGKPPLDDNGQPAKPFVYLKDAWRIDHPSLQKEGLVLRTLNRAGVQYVPTAVYHGDLVGQSTLSYENWSKLRPGETCKLKAHRHYRLVVEEVGKPLSEFSSGAGLVTAILHVVQAHEQACQAGYIHRDISAGNILLYKAKNGRWHGLLNDWELAAKYVMGQSVEDTAAPGECSVLERTGTWQFLSAHCLNDNEKTVDIPDDLESIFHVLLYYAVRFLPHNIKDDAVGLFLYQYFDDYSQSYSGNTCGPAKYAAVKGGEIDLTLLTGGSAAKGKAKKKNLLKFYTPAVASESEPNTGSVPSARSHPINDLISTVLQWLKEYYALDKDEPLEETNTEDVGPTVDIEDDMELAGGDPDLLALDAAAASAPSIEVQRTQTAFDPASSTSLGPGAVETAATQNSTQASSPDPAAKMTHGAFKAEIYQQVKHKHTWPRGDKGPDKRPRSFAVPGKNAAARAAAAAAVAAGGCSPQTDSTKRKQGKDAGSKTKRRNGRK
ncbi:hypothetical protein C8T65DRAFT_826736 [Cerioporus squamosus]|nr:hypothetical protein C8T65DRAFT_826736 [Cerioporus squamosus]